MNVTLHKIIDELEKLGLKRGWTDAEVVKYSYGDCHASFIIIYKKSNYCTIFRQLQINRFGEYYTNESSKYNLLSYMENPISIDYILGEMKTLITEYKELKVKYKKYLIEQDFV